MARSITLTFDGRNELLLKAIEAFEQGKALYQRRAREAS